MFKKYFLPILSFSFLFLPLMVLYAQGIKIPVGTGLPDGTVASVLDNVLNWLLMIFVIIATISFVITGLQFIFSFGGASGTEAQAKKNFTYTIIAIFIVGGSLIILNAILGLLGPASTPSVGNTSGFTNWAEDAANLNRAESGLLQETPPVTPNLPNQFDTGIPHESGASGSPSSPSL